MESISALNIHVRGIVQGVGFRPFVYGLATRLQLKGWVLNTSSGVVIEVEGPSSILEEFLQDLVKKAPPISKIEEIESHPVSPNGYTRFEIRESKLEAGYVLISPDIATGDMVRVRGSEGSLQNERARGADVRIVYSPLDADAERSFAAFSTL